MGIWDTIQDLVEAVTPWGAAEAEAPAEDKAAAAPEADDDDSGEEEEEEEDDDEPKDPKDQFEEDCKNSKQCAPAKHHFDECVERVTNPPDGGETDEDCVEECKKRALPSRRPAPGREARAPVR
ncbi:ubiquinol-cytochrome C reductase hinge protein-domain-containing protein [Durotheca rogersii]|uniref:ubiquinol-cytochrome C reductase hinge protein-domain-containing protein n=1 Tax=Durotheca rogersii TaxID=419775 RepID=UPI0022209887|nr:ubiquinol-cytochrome C reductase hinge protein-domain-containing protein [Durotheca rogersii]KAI5866237.1 ubiquinol-cytochrome C reductase hinge protein-domain-containing protein [Durotheca rogersii]